MGLTEREAEFYSIAKARGLKPGSHPFVDKAIEGVSDRLFRISVQESWLRSGKVTPPTLVLLCLFFIVSLAFAHSLRTLILHSVLLLLAVGASGLRLKRLFGPGLLIAYCFSFAMAIPVLFSFVFKGHIIVPLAVPFGAIGITREGCLTALTFFIRTTTSVTAVFALIHSVRWIDLLRVMRSLRILPIFIQTIGMTVSFLHLLLRQAHDSYLGKKSRMICRSPIREEYRWVGVRLANSWERSLQLMTDVEQAMVARGFSGKVAIFESRSIPGAEWAMIVLSGLVFLGVHFV